MEELTHLAGKKPLHLPGRGPLGHADMPDQIRGQQPALIGQFLKPLKRDRPLQVSVSREVPVVGHDISQMVPPFKQLTGQPWSIS